MSVNDMDRVQPATYEVVEDALGRGTVARLSVTFEVDGACLAQALFEEFAHALDNDQELPKNLTVQDVLQILARKHASCSEGWHIWANDPSSASWEAASVFADQTIRSLFPDIAWKVD
ncbi:hypothetical protein AB0A69_08150 [Streptomyces sp. NPDC045431]|uniref:hypothetical protein n=1 Tax=Streptomyces sp. NPDC045431 TaxID=3155613 RepID=UPI0033C932AA